MSRIEIEDSLYNEHTLPSGNAVDSAVCSLRAKLGKRRVSEARLIGLSWFGGLFGGWLAMKTFRHKTRKSSFRTRMVLVSVVNFAWLWIYLAVEAA